MSGALYQASAASAAVAVSIPRKSGDSTRAGRLGAELAAALSASAEADLAADAAENAIKLDAEKLRVYHLALDLQVMANTLVPSIHRVIRDQFERASLSIVLSLAEGCGRVSRRQRRYHFGVARGSATECAALADVLRLRKLAPASECYRARSLAVRCVQMTSKLIDAMGPSEPKVEAA